jgi:hypothetical protein
MEDYLKDEIIAPMRQSERREFCLNDVGVYKYLLSCTYNKVKCPNLIKNVRAYAHLLCRFFLPLMAENDWKTTEEVLKIDNRDAVQDRLLELGGINAFFEDSDSYIRDLENEAVSLSFS